ncbi:GNAT family N-acetyltransferase [Nitrosococcus wardiae]|uniref:N-acetyltransferase n=1 Tax=Nitrosococcus wardiae TaxID=1814290 RepID=A0A4P7BXK0_9GAMM|nr:N-acetyltransferase [Nitrosococcus wardiae]QBQ53116.1 N-acetyltransferase [Nitrosococcus wardiae]
MNLQVRKALESDRQSISIVVIAAFGTAQENEITDLIIDLLADPSAQPLLSLVATVNDHVVGHILFTNVRIKHSQRLVPSAILAPLSVHPEYQNQGIGGRLIKEGLKQLKAAGIELVFVLGHPGYYLKYGFSAAGIKGFDAPYPIPPENSDAWMVQELHPGVIGHVKGQVICADVLNNPKHWRE